MKKDKIIAILGQTATGKTKLGVELACNFNGEIISADSRQVYIGMDIGTGKDLQDFTIINNGSKINIPHHLIDILSPKKDFNLAEYQKKAYLAIKNVIERKKIPIIVGGSGLYAQSIIDEYELSESKPDLTKRKILEKKESNELFNYLKRKNKEFALNLNNSEKNNKQRLIRYIEKVDSKLTSGKKHKESAFNPLLIAITLPKETLHKRINERLIHRLEKEAMIDEVIALHKSGIGYKRLENFGLEYRYIAYYLQNKLDYDEMKDKLYLAIKQFAKKQLNWLKRWEKQGVTIHWVKNYKQAELLTKEFLKH
ncbi:tRNA (adenosine(37)-N6)-dimethylallyltransferase MiaA [Patescibacteria group bacterium]|nr:tRNA (adenosine(37)-N6)-dimethylallyltransferase MiaA [Patescibacteria group bacterium]